MATQLIHDPGPLKFVITDNRGNQYIGECFAVSMSQSLGYDHVFKTTINFTGHKVRVVPARNKRKNKVVKKKTVKRKRK